MKIVVDSSAVLAILLDEPEAEAFFLRIDRTLSAMLSSGNLIEIHRVVQSRMPHRLAEVDLLLHELRLEIVPVDAAQVALARNGMERFGKGRGAPPAVLNFGDLFAYALARAAQAPLLFKGADFSATDVIPALTL